MQAKLEKQFISSAVPEEERAFIAHLIGGTSINNEVSKSDFWKKMEELDREIARFQVAVDKCCQAISEFKANL
jgi:hypothetical protein